MLNKILKKFDDEIGYLHPTTCISKICRHMEGTKKFIRQACIDYARYVIEGEDNIKSKNQGRSCHCELLRFEGYIKGFPIYTFNGLKDNEVYLISSKLSRIQQDEDLTK